MEWEEEEEERRIVKLEQMASKFNFLPVARMIGAAASVTLIALCRASSTEILCPDCCVYVCVCFLCRLVLHMDWLLGFAALMLSLFVFNT